MTRRTKNTRPPRAPKKQLRGSHADRRAATQARVIEACIATLYELGFQATTTSLVAERAGVSRGALLQQFPTRLDMILAAAEHGIREQCAATARLLARKPAGVPRYKAMTDAMWKDTRQPLRIVLIELQLAARADPDLARGLEERVAPVLRTEFADAWLVAREAGIEDRNAANAQAFLTLASLWGLAVMQLGMHARSDLAPAYALLKDNRDRLLDRLAQRKRGAR